MTDRQLRDHFAGLALQFLISTGHERYASHADLAKHAYEIAEAMMTERAAREQVGHR